ncbi:predicted protein [Sclerotinia sclerotiorum 1980 UF-70]|uniref:Uncharacterized protein n=1 Tax=Sclerotinia sclerotiorum (strain ATCC 18683 / 1980 / Ss-1) TaxID=665079 RepID=A7F707_SCLS1|nr:predicted protein [Sclerotinia sclerotiorum 1980 UF-70]EDN98528.1 predicted protein [Sclerotinia sclerotiorum 1980 UF-70]
MYGDFSQFEIVAAGSSPTRFICKFGNVIPRKEAAWCLLFAIFSLRQNFDSCFPRISPHAVAARQTWFLIDTDTVHAEPVRMNIWSSKKGMR